MVRTTREAYGHGDAATLGTAAWRGSLLGRRKPGRSAGSVDVRMGRLLRRSDALERDGQTASLKVGIAALPALPAAPAVFLIDAVDCALVTPTPQTAE